MQHIALTPFGRGPATLAQVAAASRVPAPCPAMDKWLLFAQVRTARARLGVIDRDLTVLHALLSFLPARELRDGEPLVVFPSNASLSDRAHGMPESTLRRHLAALVKAGLIARRDSPNGKRYAARSRDGGLVTAYGFDLRPLLLRAPAIEAAAGEAEAEALALRQRRAEATVALRDATKLATLLGSAELGSRLEAARTVLRRRLGLAELDALAQALGSLVEEMHERLAPAEEMSGSDSENERHQQSHIQKTHESESGREGLGQDRPAAAPRPEAAERRLAASAAIPLELVLKACPEVLAYTEKRPRHWPDLVRLAERLRAYMGVAVSTWSEAQSRMGPELASATLAVLLQRFAEIRNPGGYLRHLTRRHVEGRLSLGSMIHALLGRRAEAPS